MNCHAVLYVEDCFVYIHQLYIIHWVVLHYYYTFFHCVVFFLGGGHFLLHYGSQRKPDFVFIS